MKIETILIRVGIPDANGNVFSAEALEAMAKEDPEKYRIDGEGNLRQLMNDTETEELYEALLGTQAEGMEGNEALDKFKAVLQYREDNKTAGIVPKPGRCAPVPRAKWPGIKLKEDE